MSEAQIEKRGFAGEIAKVNELQPTGQPKIA